MQDQTDKKKRTDRLVEQKHVGDETPNPLPDDDYSSKQPLGNDGPAHPDADSSGQ